jgi:hypothetical protein
MNLTLERIANVLQSEVAPYGYVLTEAMEVLTLMWRCVGICYDKIGIDGEDGFVKWFSSFNYLADRFTKNIMPCIHDQLALVPKVLIFLYRMRQAVIAVRSSGKKNNEGECIQAVEEMALEIFNLKRLVIRINDASCARHEPQVQPSSVVAEGIENISQMLYYAGLCYDKIRIVGEDGIVNWIISFRVLAGNFIRDIVPHIQDRSQVREVQVCLDRINGMVSVVTMGSEMGEGVHRQMLNQIVIEIFKLEGLVRSINPTAG